tara:strand:+ start:489 stop:731 length:243 start_codon:yes stop_codon:yes gene_type:complete
MGGVKAAFGTFAQVFCTRVAVVTSEGLAGDTCVGSTKVKAIADITIVAVGSIGQRQVYAHLLAALDGADIQGTCELVVTG